jgi:hypothetical protein
VKTFDAGADARALHKSEFFRSVLGQQAIDFVVFQQLL